MADHRLNRSLVFLLASIAFCCAAQAQTNDFPYEKYKERTLAELVETGASMPKTDDAGRQLQSPDLILDADFHYSRTRVKYLGSSRPMSAQSKELLGLWQKSFSIAQNIVDLFADEYLFRECDKEYWIPVQKQVANYFAKELKPGDMVTLFLLRASGKRVKDTKEYNFLFLVSEFDK